MKNKRPSQKESIAHNRRLVLLALRKRGVRNPERLSYHGAIEKLAALIAAEA